VLLQFDDVLAERFAFALVGALVGDVVDGELHDGIRFVQRAFDAIS
jgi:hypothetical protein